ncbi:MAG: thermonuclease family protein [bacterium]|nr:thermonuclease family protein [bacterium]
MLAIVTEVIDGDTVRVRLSDGTIEKVRIIGMDTPESKDPRKTVECFAHEATEHLRDMLKGSSNVTTLVRDDISGNRDTYQRLLRHLEITPTADVTERDVARRMIRDGYAYAYTKYPFEKVKMEQHIAAEKEARTQALGLWAPGECEEDPRVAAHANSKTTDDKLTPSLDNPVEAGKDISNPKDGNNSTDEQEQTTDEGWPGLALFIVVLGGIAYIARPSTWKKWAK